MSRSGLPIFHGETVVAHAGVSQSAFDEVLESAEDCMLTAFSEGLERLSQRVKEATRREERWLGRIRAGLVALLGFLDDEPQSGRLLILQAPVAATAALDCSQRLHGVLVKLINEGRGKATASAGLEPSPALTGELIASGVFSVIRARMLDPDGRPLVELAPSLMPFIVAPYLGEAVARVELSGRSASANETLSRAAELSVLLTYRTTLVLRAIASTPRSSNGEIAKAAGITDAGQISHLLSRLEQRGLIERVRTPSGSRRTKAWLLTPCGERVILSFGIAQDSGASPRTNGKVRQAA